MLKLTANNLIGAVDKAQKARPWVKSLGNGLYRVARRPTDRDREWRPHFVQLAVAGSGVFAECDCEGFKFNRKCYHVAAIVRRFIPKAHRKAA